MSRSPVDADNIDIENQLETPIEIAGQCNRISVCFTPDASSCSAYPSPKFEFRPSRYALTSLTNFFFSLEAIIAPKDSDTSATYWKLYGSEAEIYDKNLVDTLKGNTESMVFLVSGDGHRRLQVYIAVSYDCLAEHFVLCHRRSIYHRNIQDAPTQ